MVVDSSDPVWFVDDVLSLLPSSKKAPVSSVHTMGRRYLLCSPATTRWKQWPASRALGLCSFLQKPLTTYLPSHYYYQAARSHRGSNLAISAHRLAAHIPLLFLLLAPLRL